MQLLRIVRCCCEETFGTLVVAPECKEEKEVRLGKTELNCMIAAVCTIFYTVNYIDPAMHGNWF